jgi:hypothetical protein
MSAHSRAVTTPGPRAEMFEDPTLTFAARLKRSYKAGQHSRLQGLTRVPPYDDYDICLAWVCGYDAVQAEIDELNEEDLRA